MKDPFKAFLVATTTLGFFGILTLLFFRIIPMESRDLFIALAGVVGSKWGSIIDYHFGSSSGSARKTDMLNHLNGTDDGTANPPTSPKE